MTLQCARREIAVAERKRARTDQVPAVDVVDGCKLLDGEGSISLPGTPGLSLPAGVSKLDAGCSAVRLDEARDVAKRRDELVVPDAEVSGRPAAAALDLGRLDDDKARAACGELARVGDVPGVGKPRSATYCSIGGTTIRFLSSTSRIRSGENSSVSFIRPPLLISD